MVLSGEMVGIEVGSMCGIVGMLRFTQEPVTGDVLKGMCAAIAHRGPDDQGIYIEGSVGLAMRRLSIIDLATGHQPMCNEDGTMWIVFNGEIYNHSSLRKQLVSRGHQFRSQSDTETILHLYEDHGRRCVEVLRGMFAFAIWDSKKRLLFVARDRLGIKPLYYYHASELFLFASEIKALLTYTGLRCEFQQAVLSEYLAFGYLSGDETFYKNVRKLMPGHWAEINERGDIVVEQYWDLPLSGEATEHNEKYYVSKYRELLEDAVRSHLMSDVPLGVFLSGGLDSSVVAALTTHIRRAPIETFSVGYAEQTYSELPFARSVAEHLNSIHHEICLTRGEFFNALPQLIWHEDEPIAWPSSVALYFVARLAREHVKVVLTGEGSDETLGGYSRYAFTLKNVAVDRIYRRLIPGPLRRWLQEVISESRLLGADLHRKLAHTFLARDGSSWSSFYFDNFFCAFTESEQRELLSNEVIEPLLQGRSYREMEEYWQQSSGTLLRRLLYTDIKSYLVELLMKQDNMSMAASIESRVPFLDDELVEFVFRIPERLLVKGFSGKVVLKKAAEDLLPASIVHRTKMGFPTPWSQWLAGPQLDGIENLISGRRCVDRGWLKPDVIKRLFQEHRAKIRDHSTRLWRLMNLELWFRVCMERDSMPWESIADHNSCRNVHTPMSF